jgi:hypothetical protein
VPVDLRIGQNCLTRNLVIYNNARIAFQAGKMDTDSAFGFEDLFTSALRGMANAISERHGENEVQQFARCQVAVHMIAGFQPRDVIELMLAGHCVMLHEVMTADVHDSLSGEAATNRRSVVALNKAFNDNLDRLERYRRRPAEGQRDAPEAAPLADAAAPPARPTAAAAPAQPNRAARRQAARAELHAAATATRTAHPPGALRNASPQAGPPPEGTVVRPPTPEDVANCRANPEAMAALAAGDPARFARALGVDQPGEAFLAAANCPGSPFDAEAAGPWPMGELAGTRKA